MNCNHQQGYRAMKEESNQALRNPIYYYFFNGVNLFVLVKFSAPGLMS